MWLVSLITGPVAREREKKHNELQRHVFLVATLLPSFILGDDSETRNQKVITAALIWDLRGVKLEHLAE